MRGAWHGRMDRMLKKKTWKGHRLDISDWRDMTARRQMQFYKLGVLDLLLLLHQQVPAQPEDLGPTVASCGLFRVGRPDCSGCFMCIACHNVVYMGLP